MRRAFSDSLVKLGGENDRLIFLTGDLGFQVFDRFRELYPGRYVNVGVAEAQLVDCAAGLALAGWRPIVYSIASFMTGRAFEQIRIMVSYHQLPVIVVGAGGGYLYGSSGVTHHAKEDLALMSLLPGMTVVAPGDPFEVEQLMPQLLQHQGPSYLRIGKFGEVRYDAPAAVVLGKARHLRDGAGVAVLTTGCEAARAVEAWEILNREGLPPAVYQFHTVKPLDTETLDRLGRSCDALVVVEEHAESGGLRAAVARWKVTTNAAVRVVGLGPDDELALGNPSQEELRARYGYDAAAIVRVCRHWSRREPA
jgi:transketolase